MEPKISIIITCYNEDRYIEKAVGSAANQTYENKEIIVVDDGSNSRTKAVLKTLESKFDILITQENLGTGAARNNGIKAATGEYILNLDSDDFFEPTFCEKAVNILLTSAEIINVTCYAKWFKDDNNSQIFKPSGGGLENFLFKSASIGNSLFPKSAWQKIGGYDQNMSGFEDWEFFIRLHTSGKKTFVIPEILFNYRNSENSRNFKANKKKYILSEYIFLKHSELYKKFYPNLIRHLLSQISNQEAGKIKSKASLEYRIGKILTWPIRKASFVFRLHGN